MSPSSSFARSQHWPMLPSSLGKYLTVCTAGRYFSTSNGLLFFEEAAKPNARHQSLLLDIGFNLLQYTWDANPADPTQGAQLLELDQRLGQRLPAQKSALIRSLVQSSRIPVHWQEQQQELAAQGADVVQAEITKRLQQEPSNLHWWFEALRCAKSFTLWPWLLELGKTLPAGVCQFYAQHAVAASFFHLGEYEQALTVYQAIQAEVPSPGLDAVIGECLVRLGEKAAGLSVWRRSLQTSPWQTNVILRAFDVLHGLDQPGPLPEGSTSLLLYSWNKAHSLDRTLASLAESELGQNKIFVLNNGSTDTTAEVLRAWHDRLGSDRIVSVETLVNVGAPAARNWLMHLPEVMASDNAVYMDDDILLPQKWLGYLGTAQRTYPDAHVWGCRVVDDGAPHNVQHTDEFLSAPETRGSVGFCCQCWDEMDYGQFTYLRPCTSVTGCLHLFRTKELLESGGFDLQFSPSQFDDAEHDLRLGAAGRYAVYQGHLRVLHERSTGGTYDSNSRASYGIEGNFKKLNYKYAPEVIEEIRTRTYAVVVRDIREKLEAVLAEEEVF